MTASPEHIRLVWEHIRDRQETIPQTPRTLRVDRPGGLSRNDILTATTQALELGFLVERGLPLEQRKGSRQVGLFATELAPTTLGGVDRGSALTDLEQPGAVTCRWCLELANSGKCQAALRGEMPMVGLSYFPHQDAERLCPSYRQRPGSPTQ